MIVNSIIMLSPEGMQQKHFYCSIASIHDKLLQIIVMVEVSIQESRNFFLMIFPKNDLELIHNLVGGDLLDYLLGQQIQSSFIKVMFVCYHNNIHDNEH